MAPAITQLVYLHGFRSSPKSAKAVRTAAWVEHHHPQLRWWCPQLPPSPRAAMDLLEQGLRGAPGDTLGIIGSSLGGFYATALAQRLHCRAVVLNPAVDPARDLVRHIGQLQAWHSDEQFYFRAEYIDELRAIGAPELSAPQKFLAIIAKGDEVLSWTEMAQRYGACRIELLEGGDHALSDYDRHLPSVMAFLGLPLRTPSAPASTPPAPRRPR